MKLLSGFLDDAYTKWLHSSINCCVIPRVARSQDELPFRVEKPMRIEHSQPRLIPAPVAERQSRSHDWIERGRTFASRASSRGTSSFSVRRRRKDSFDHFHSGRPHTQKLSIGYPQEFRHLEDSYQPRRTEYFRPLELSIYVPGQAQISPILPYFKPEDIGFPDEDEELPYPPTAYTHSRSGSSLSFRIPRKPVRSSSGSSSYALNNTRPESLTADQLLAALEAELPQAPKPARLRASTAPPAYERVRSILHEKYELEQRLKDIEETIEERQSVYFNSRPVSRATTVDRRTSVSSVYEESHEPMPALHIPPSFAARINTPSPTPETRPQTAPSRPVLIPSRLKSFTEASAAFTSHPITSAISQQTTTITSSASSHPSHPNNLLNRELPPPPPLPLVLQSTQHPTLKRKKSFSRISNWLSSSTSRSRNNSLSSITNTPKALTSREGFYQCVLPHEMRRTSSTSSITSRPSSTTSEMEEDPVAPPTTTSWSPYSSPGKTYTSDPFIEPGSKLAEKEMEMRMSSMDSERSLTVGARRDEEKSLELERTRTFGEKQVESGMGEKWLVRPVYVPGRNSVGVAF
ncbi:hypothetical protein B0O99DRAFT_670806 [Bisporella sp. PMI_857]|nr:hypothetical protein B0O99DRAFT_670806 [Bisporella sp. PMI_857]